MDRVQIFGLDVTSLLKTKKNERAGPLMDATMQRGDYNELNASSQPLLKFYIHSCYVVPGSRIREELHISVY